MKPLNRFAPACAAMLVVSLIGCGGSGSSHSTGSNGSTGSTGGGGQPLAKGRLVVNVAWPKPSDSRVIPDNSQSLKIEVSRDGTVFATKTLVRPDASATFDELPTGDLTVRTTAYATPDATGVALATAEMPAKIAADAATDLEIALASTIVSLVPSVSKASLDFGGFAPAFSVVAKDASGAVVPLAANALRFASDDTTYAVLDATNRILSGSLAGNTAITVTEKDSGQSVKVPVSVFARVKVSTQGGASSTVTLGDKLPLTAFVDGDPSDTVTWTVIGGGTVTSSGLYTAPQKKGTYRVLAVSDKWNDSAQVTVTVQSGSGNVTIK